MCKSILVSGISEDTTHYVIKLYFQSPKNHGGPVERVLFKYKNGRAVANSVSAGFTGLNSNVP